MKGDKNHKETDAALAAVASGIVTGISALPFYEIFAKEGSFLEHLQTIGAAFFMPGLFISTVLSGNIHDGSLTAGAAIDVIGYTLILYGVLRWRRRTRGSQARASG
jgi:hypothetical protein